MNIFTAIGIVFLVCSALRMAYDVVVAINPSFVVLSMYRLLALLRGTPSLKASRAWWNYLSENCSEARPCIECLREEQAQRRAGGA